MRDHGGITSSLGHLNGFQGLGQGADLVELDQDRVTDRLVYAALEDLGVGYKQVVAHQLHFAADLVGQHFPASPVGLIHTILDGDDRVTLGQAGQIVRETFSIEDFAFASQVVIAILEELAGSAVQGQGDIVAQGVTGIGNGFGDGRQRVLVGRQVRREAAFITNRSAEATGLQHGFEVMENFGAHAQRIGEGFRANRLNHELLDVDVVIGMLAAVDDVHHRNGHRVDAWSAIQIGDVRVQRHALGLSSSLGRSQGHSEDGVGTQGSFVLSTVEGNHRQVEGLLVGGIFAQQQVADRAIDISHGLQHTLAQVTALVAITQFQRFTRTGGGTGRRAGAADDTPVENYISLHSRVTTGVENLTAFDVDDLCHCV